MVVSDICDPRECTRRVKLNGLLDDDGRRVEGTRYDPAYVICIFRCIFALFPGPTNAQGLRILSLQYCIGMNILLEK